MGIANSAKNRLGITGELFRFFWRIGRGWLVPIVICIVLCGLLMVVASNPAIAPWIYSMF